MSRMVRSGLRDGPLRPSKMEGPTSNEYLPPLCTRVNVCAEPPGLMCDSSTATFEPYSADMAPQARPPMPEPMTMTSYSSLRSSPPRPLPVPLYVGLSYPVSWDMSYEKVMTLSRFVSLIWSTLSPVLRSMSCCMRIAAGDAAIDIIAWRCAASGAATKPYDAAAIDSMLYAKGQSGGLRIFDRLPSPRVDLGPRAR